MNFKQLLLNTRIRLGDPVAQQPSTRTLLLLISSQVQSFLNLANLSSKPWAVDEVTLIAVPGREEYVIAASSQFGKPIQVRTQNPTDLGHIETDVEFYELGDLNFDWSYPHNFNGWSYDGSPNTAARIAFFRRQGLDQVYARIIPTPQQQAQYQILYQIGVYGETASMDDIPILPQHHALIEVRSALDALPHTEWDSDSKANEAKRVELGLTLGVTERRLADEYNQYIRTATVSRRLGFRDLYSID